MVVNVKLKFLKNYSETLKDDFEGFKSLLPKNVGIALQDTMEQFVSDIKDEIKNEFYPSYTPKDYSRRSDHPEFGTPLEADENFNVLVDDKRMSATMEYFPDTNNIRDEQLGRLQYQLPDMMLAAAFYNGELGMPPLLWLENSDQIYDNNRNFIDPVVTTYFKHNKADQVFVEALKKTPLADKDVVFETDGNCDTEPGDYFLQMYKGWRGGYTRPRTFGRYMQQHTKIRRPKSKGGKSKKK